MKFKIQESKKFKGIFIENSCACYSKYKSTYLQIIHRKTVNYFPLKNRQMVPRYNIERNLKIAEDIY